MTKKPREEISYKTIYENLDVKTKHVIKPIKLVEINPIKNIYQKVSDKGKYLDKNKLTSNDVHYCLDEYDIKFLRDEKGNVEIDLDSFEFAIDRLEKEWHKILKNKIKENFIKIKPKDICDICTLKEIDENIIIVCQGCGISIHRDCYGSSYDIDEVFICLGCYYYNKKPMCMFCTSNDGVMKITTDCRWGHITCVLFNDLLDFDNPNSKEPIDISRYRENVGSCIFCDDTHGTKIQCNYGLCPNFYHVSCALVKAYFDMNNNVTYCAEHNPQKTKSIFSNSHSFLRNVVGYRKLSDPPLIRKKVPLTKRKNTILMDIINIKPYVSNDVRFKIFQNKYFKDKKNVLESIFEYWIQRKVSDNSSMLPHLNLMFDIF